MHGWGVVGWGGACNNVHVNLRSLSVAAGRCMYAQVGWGVVGHVIAFM